jgi:hypothetical protein
MGSGQKYPPELRERAVQMVTAAPATMKNSTSAGLRQGGTRRTALPASPSRTGHMLTSTYAVRDFARAAAMPTRWA